MANPRIGKIRLVNPMREPRLVAEFDFGGWVLSARTVTAQSFGIYAVVDGQEFYCGREFSRRELMRLAHGQAGVLPGQATEDLLGEIPATEADPRQWKWAAFGGAGESRLRKAARPTLAQLRELATLALDLDAARADSYVNLDEWECWVVDKESLEPLALVLTAPTQEEINTLTYSPIWRPAANSPEDLRADKSSVSDELYRAWKGFQGKVNARINENATDAEHWATSSFRYKARIFHRDACDGTITEHLPNGERLQREPEFVPTGELAEPYQSEYNNLFQQILDYQDVKEEQVEWPSEL